MSLRSHEILEVAAQSVAISGWRVGLRVETGSATFDNVTVHGANAFLDPNTGLEELLMDDPFYHINIGSTPYMWGLVGANPTTPTQSAWEVVNGGASHGKVLKGTASTMGTEGFRGDQDWINQPGETSYMNYFVQADVKLESPTADAGLRVRVEPPQTQGVPGDQFYLCKINAAAGSLELWCHYHDGVWHTYQLGFWSPVPNPTQWHTIAVRAVGTDVRCYLDGFERIAVSGLQGVLLKGCIGFRVDGDSALFDNVKVLDLRQ